LAAAQRDDRRAQEELVRRYAPLVRHLAGQLRCPRGCDRADLAQEAWVGVLVAIRRWDPGRGPFPAFATVCAFMHAIKALDAAVALKHLPLSHAESLDTEHSHADARDSAGGSLEPERVVLARERLELLIGGLSSLNARERLALAGVLDGKSHQQLADEHGQSRKGITTALRRAREKLAAHDALAA
jgi:RNA polymerase sigma factor (sigma-70 family)